MNRLTLTPTVALALALAAMSVPASAASYIPLGPKTYTPQPDIVTPQAPTVTPQAPTVTKSGGGFTSSSSEPHIGNPNPSGSGWYNAKCDTIADVNADCVPRSLHPGHGGMPIPVKTTVTANPDLVTPNPDIVTPQPPTCSQPGWSLSGGLGNYAC